MNTNLFELINPANAIRLLTIVATLISLVVASFLGWVNVRKIRLLNQVLKTPIAIFLFGSAILYLIACVGTLVLGFNLWISPLLLLLRN